MPGLEMVDSGYPGTEVNVSSDSSIPQLVCTVVDGGEALGYLVIDSTINGHSSGGLRLMPDVDEAEVRGLAHAMTLKYGFLGLPQGGAKAGVRGDPEEPQQLRRERLAAFGRGVAPLLRSRTYLPGADMGTSTADILHMLRVAGVRTRPRDGYVDRGGYYTALTVFSCAGQAVRHSGRSLEGATVAIQGFGKVGSALATLLADAGARVVAISTVRGAIFNGRGLDVALLANLAARAGSHVVDLYPEADPIDPAALLELPVDLLCPCARQAAVHEGNAPSVRARILCPGANNPITAEAERMLFQRGVICLPDFVANSGGVLGGRMEGASANAEQIASFIDSHFGRRVAWLLQQAAREEVLPREIAVPMALRRFDRMRQTTARPTLKSRLFQVGLESYRRGWVPRRLVGGLSTAYFERILPDQSSFQPPVPVDAPREEAAA